MRTEATMCKLYANPKGQTTKTRKHKKTTLKSTHKRNNWQS